MKTIETTVNKSLKQPVSEHTLSAIIKSGKMEKEFMAHIFAMFTDVAPSDLLAFALRHKIELEVMETYYLKNVKKYYPNPALEALFKIK